MIEAHNPRTGETRRARALDTLARQIGGRTASVSVSHSEALEPPHLVVRITRPARDGGGNHVLGTWIVRGLGS